MPFIPRTPESLLQRSDSKNPGTTCKGVTTSGRPCRRTLAAAASSPSSSPSAKRGVVAVLQDVDEDHDGAAAFFCWQHKEQAEMLASNGSSNPTKVVGLEERSSIDSLVGRLGILDIQDNPSSEKVQEERHGDRQVRRDDLPKQWQNVPGPLISVPRDAYSAKATPSRSPRIEKERRSKVGSTFSISFFCCVSSVDPEDIPPTRARRHRAAEVTQKKHHPTSRLPNGFQPTSKQLQTPSTPPNHQPKSSQPQPSLTGIGSGSPIVESPISDTDALSALVPRSLDASTASSLFCELAKPLSPADTAGYIYIFWLTPATDFAPSATLTSSLLTNSTPSSPRKNNSPSRNGQHLSDFATSRSSPSEGDNDMKIRLKIGRAANVQRRMNQWSRQCGYRLSLLRWYPYQPTSAFGPPSPPANPLGPTLPEASPGTPTSLSPDAPRKVPVVARVERLIHLELAKHKVSTRCAGCAKLHREWFEIDPRKEEIARVDRVIRRWVEWADKAAAEME